jgi:hypothetical protein
MNLVFFHLVLDAFDYLSASQGPGAKMATREAGEDLAENDHWAHPVHKE